MKAAMLEAQLAPGAWLLVLDFHCLPRHQLAGALPCGSLITPVTLCQYLAPENARVGRLHHKLCQYRAPRSTWLDLRYLKRFLVLLRPGMIQISTGHRSIRQENSVGCYLWIWLSRKTKPPYVSIGHRMHEHRQKTEMTW
eukprot:1613587-Rhodomonas_salina.6